MRGFLDEERILIGVNKTKRPSLANMILSWPYDLHAGTSLRPSLYQLISALLSVQYEEDTMPSEHTESLGSDNRSL